MLTGGGAPLAGRYEHVRSPLDVDDQEAPIIPLSPLAYVPGAALVVLDGILDHRRCGRPQSLLAHPLLRRLDDIAYGTGLWAGALRSRSVAHLLPRFAARTARSASGPVPEPGPVQPRQLPGGPGG